MIGDLPNAGFPVIYAQHDKVSYASFPAIIIDSEAIGSMAAERFLDHGFENFAYCGLNEFVWSRLRCRPFASPVRTWDT